MMPRKKRKILLVVLAIVFLFIVGGISLILLYLNTDMLKSNATLFAKYLGQNIENMEEVLKQEENDFHQLLQQKPYEEETTIKVNYTENIGKTSENNDNAINQLRLKMKGQMDPSHQYEYRDIRLLKEEQEIAKVEYMQNEQVYGIRFSDLFRQFILMNRGEIGELIGETDFIQEGNHNQFDEMAMEKEIKELFQFSEEEKKNFQTRYINIVNQNVTKDKFSKQENQNIQINGKTINVNAYILTLSKEQMNELYIKILEELKQDEMILNKIDQLQTMLAKYNIMLESDDIREYFIQNIDKMITDIMRNNIGQEEMKIIVYENYHITRRTVIQGTDYKITLDLLPEENYLQFTWQETKNDKEIVVTYQEQANEKEFHIRNTGEEKTTEYSLRINEKGTGTENLKTIVGQYEDEFNRLTATIEQEIHLVDNFSDEFKLAEEEKINLSDLEKEQSQSILEQVISGVGGKVNQIMTEEIKQEDFMEILKAIGVRNEIEGFETVGITETEKNRFNSKFEILQGENLGSENLIRLIEAIKENFINIEVVSGTQLRLQLDRFQKNEEMARILTNFMEENKNKKYNVKVEYEEETGLAKDILLTMLEES